VRLAYLVSRYPAVSHSFILREVTQLRTQGFSVDVASINPPDRDSSRLTAVEKAEAQQTFYVKEAGIPGAFLSQLYCLFFSPVRYCRALLYALRLAKTDLRRAILCIFYFLEAGILARWMQSRGLTHLHVHFATPAATVGIILARLAPVTISLTVHGPDEFYDVPGYYLQEKIATAEFVCAIGAYARSQLMKLSPVAQWNKFELSPLGVDPGQFQRRTPGASSDKFEILCVGRLVPAKGQHILLAAVARVIALDRPVLLRLVGDGPDRRSLELEVRRLNLENAVRFEGALNQDQTRSCYETADVFALASFAEGIPVVLMEAMAMEIPCVTTWITGVPELIRPEIDGLLVPPSDVDAFADALIRLMDNRTLRLQLGKAARRRIEERFDLSQSVVRLADIFTRRLGAGV